MGTTPFAGKADFYRKYRGGYAPEAIEAVVRLGGLTGREVVADLGSGTGILTQQLLPHVGLIYAVEPADDMRSRPTPSSAALPEPARRPGCLPRPST